MAIVVEIADSAQRTSWNNFVQTHPLATFFHLFEWQDVLQRNKSSSYFLLAKDNEQVCGIMPLARIKSTFFGDHLISLPFCTTAGPLVTNEETRLLLLEYAGRLARDLRVDDLEIRSRVPQPGPYIDKALYCEFRKEIFSDSESNLSAIPRKQRAMVRKGIKARLETQIVRADNLDAFYAVYSESVRNLGTPVYSREYFESLHDAFADAMDILIVRTTTGTPVASVLSFYFRNEVLPYYGGSIPAARDLKANDYMYWQLMNHAVTRGASLFDYGRSKVDSGPYHFKRNWGFEPQQLHYQYELVRAKEMPQVNPNNPKFKYLIEVWKRLPLAVANAIGPKISRYLG